MSYHLWHISSAHTKPLISQTVSPWTAVPFSCLQAMFLKSASCLSYLSALDSFICIYFLIFPSCHFWPSDCLSVFSVWGISACWCGKEQNRYNNAVTKLALKSIKKNFHLSFCATCSPWTKLCISERTRYPRGLNKEMQERTTGCLIVQNKRFLPLEVQILGGCSLTEFM